MVPNGVGTGTPPAKSFSPRLVWQSAQLPVAASARPRLISAGSKDCGACGSLAAIAGRQTIANAATAPAIATPATANPMFRDNAMSLQVTDPLKDNNTTWPDARKYATPAGDMRGRSVPPPCA